MLSMSAKPRSNDAFFSYQPIHKKRPRPSEATAKEPSWVSKSHRKEPTTLHQAVESNDLESLQRLLQQEKFQADVNNKNEDGQTPLHLAAQKGSIRSIEVLEEYGADPYLLNNRGLSPIYLAAEHDNPGCVEVLLAAMQEQPLLQKPWHDEDQITTLLANATNKTPKTKKEREEQVDSVTEHLTGIQASEFNDREELFSYISHLNSWTGSTLGADSEGWDFENVLAQRIRSMSQLLLREKRIPANARDGQSQQESRAALLKELTSMTETLLSARQGAAVAKLSDYHVAKKLNQIEAKKTVSQLLALSEGQTKTMPIGFPGHAIYMGICRSGQGNTDNLTFYITNLGDGYLHTHDSETGKVFPRAFRIPLANREILQNLIPQLEEFFAKIYHINDIETYADWQDLYSVVAGFQRLLKKHYQKDRIEVQPDGEGWVAMTPQTAGNCTLKNHSAGMMIRLGRPLFKWFKGKEKDFVMQRTENLVTQALYKEKEGEKESYRLKELIDQRGQYPSSLTDFLDKPRIKGIAKDLSHRTLASLVTKGENEVLNSLIELKANFQNEDKDGNSLLHRAIREGNIESARMLLDRGLKMNRKNHLGRTPLHEAIRMQNPEAAELLLEYGASTRIKDKDGKTQKAMSHDMLTQARQLHKLISNGGQAV